MIKWDRVFITACLFASVAVYAHEAHHHSGAQPALDQARPQPLKGESVYNLDSTWTNQDGKETKLASFRGQPVVVAMVYTSCQGACPMTISDLKRIEDGLPATVRSKVRFAVFSFDSKRDTPAKLKEFAKARALDVSRWSLFHGEPAAVRKLSAVLGIRYKKDKNGDFDHSNVISILDPAGVIAHQQIGLRQEPKEAIAKLTGLSGSLAR
jgi:protein SCO1/2